MVSFSDENWESVPVTPVVEEHEISPKRNMKESFCLIIKTLLK